MPEPLIEFKGFSFKYDSQAEPTLKNIALSIFEGEKILIAGPSGSGKSTLAHCINGLIPHCYCGTISGSVTVAGIDTQKADIFQLSKVVGTVLQDPDGQFIGLTAAEDIAFSLENDCVPQKELIERTHEAARLVGIDEHLFHAPNELSGGQKQRVSLAGVIVDSVQILLFDEPLANLDPHTGKQAIDLIDRIQKETKTTVVIVEHRLEDVLYRDVDRIVLMNDGSIISIQTPQEMLSRNILMTYGIREPFYITALKTAGVELKAEQHLQHIETLTLAEEDAAKVRRWFTAEPAVRLKEKEPPLLEVQNVSFSYGIINGVDKLNVLENISFTIPSGAMVSICGKNGAGKTTLSKIICGFEKLQSSCGRILCDGRDISPLSICERAEHIGYVMQNPNQMICQPLIFDEIALALRNRLIPEESVKERVYEALKICGLYPFRNWPVSALSFGQKKRVTIASMLALRPKLLILDEPTAGQDFKHYTEIMEFLRTLNAQGYTILLVTHDMHLMLEYTDRALVFADGHLIADAPSSQILCNPELVEKACLKETSLFQLSSLCNISESADFVTRFIACDRIRREKETSYGC